jgi:large subunit ribosomal protein L25
MRGIYVEAKKRDKIGKYHSKQYKEQGQIPAIVYGDDINQPVLINEKDFTKVFETVGEHSLITIDIEGTKKLVLVRDYQEHPVTRRLIHIDFFKVNPKRKVSTRVPVHPKGLAVGVKMGGVLEQYQHGLIVECLPDDIPDEIVIDVSHLKIKQGIYVRDLDLSDKIKILNQGDQAIFLIHVSRTHEDLAEEEEEEEEEGVEGEEGEETEASETEEQGSEEASE